MDRTAREQLIIERGAFAEHGLELVGQERELSDGKEVDCKMCVV